MNENLPATTREHPLILDLRKGDDGHFHWYQMHDDADTSVAGTTPEEAWSNACLVWRGTTWNLRRIAPTVAAIDGDMGGLDHA